MHVRNLPFCVSNHAAIVIVADGGDIWAPDPSKILKKFLTLYLHQYLSFPTNTQFVERGVKESGYVSLGQRGESQQSVFAISRAKLLPEALRKGREEIQLTAAPEKKNNYREREKQKF